MSERDVNRTIESVWRMESARLIAGLTRIVRDVGLAEELAQDALVMALQHWPAEGVPSNPGAWLMTTAKNRARDYFRRNVMAARKLDTLEVTADMEGRETQPAPDDRLDDDIGDDLLRLIFTSCHPAIPREGRVALTLKLIAGLTTGEIARAFLVAEPTLSQRIVRAKRVLADNKHPFEVPHGAERAERLGSVLEVIYLVFNEGYSATSGDDWLRPALCAEALRLGRIVAGLMPDEPEVHGLVALMEIQASRTGARTDADGAPILLLEQDRSLWDQMLIRRGLAALETAEGLDAERGPYTLQAAIAACHARARTAEETDWPKIAALYEILAEVTPSPVIELNRAVAHGFAFGPAAGLAIADALVDSPALKGYHLLPSVRGDLLFKLGRLAEARAAFLAAADMTRNTREQALLHERAATCEEAG